MLSTALFPLHPSDPAPFWPLPWEPDAPHKLLHLRGEQTGSVRVSGDGGRCLETTKKTSNLLPSYAYAGLV